MGCLTSKHGEDDTLGGGGADVKLENVLRGRLRGSLRHQLGRDPARRLGTGAASPAADPARRLGIAAASTSASANNNMRIGAAMRSSLASSVVRTAPTNAATNAATRAAASASASSGTFNARRVSRASTVDGNETSFDSFAPRGSSSASAPMVSAVTQKQLRMHAYAAPRPASFDIVDPTGAVIRSACPDARLAVCVAEWADVALKLAAADPGAAIANPDSVRERRERVVPPSATDATLTSRPDDVYLEI
jgi:hypothetical protein